MSTIAIVAVCVLAVVFVLCFFGVVFICYQRYSRRRQSVISEDGNSMSQNVLEFDDNVLEANSSSLELESVVTCDDGTIRQLLETEEWANDVHGVIPHCIAILKMCREVTVKLVKVAMENNHQNIHPSHMNEIVVVAKCITPRVDDVMRAISPPINTKQLEARSAALIYSVQHLALLLRNACQSYDSLEWIDAAMENMAQHMQILQNASAKENVQIVHSQISKPSEEPNDTSEEPNNTSVSTPVTKAESSQL